MNPYQVQQQPLQMGYQPIPMGISVGIPYSPSPSPSLSLSPFPPTLTPANVLSSIQTDMSYHQTQKLPTAISRQSNGLFDGGNGNLSLILTTNQILHPLTVSVLYYTNRDAMCGCLWPCHDTCCNDLSQSTHIDNKSFPTELTGVYDPTGYHEFIGKMNEAMRKNRMAMLPTLACAMCLVGIPCVMCYGIYIKKRVDECISIVKSENAKMSETGLSWDFCPYLLLIPAGTSQTHLSRKMSSRRFEKYSIERNLHSFNRYPFEVALILKIEPSLGIRYNYEKRYRGQVRELLPLLYCRELVASELVEFVLDPSTILSNTNDPNQWMANEHKRETERSEQKNQRGAARSFFSKIVKENVKGEPMMGVSQDLLLEICRQRKGDAKRNCQQLEGWGIVPSMVAGIPGAGGNDMKYNQPTVVMGPPVVQSMGIPQQVMVQPNPYQQGQPPQMIPVQIQMQMPMAMGGNNNLNNQMGGGVDAPPSYYDSLNPSSPPPQQQQGESQPFVTSPSAPMGNNDDPQRFDATKQASAPPPQSQYRF